MQQYAADDPVWLAGRELRRIQSAQVARDALRAQRAQRETQATFPSEGAGRKCKICGKTVYATEQVKVEEKNEVTLFHKGCFRCQHEDEEGLQVCNRALDIRTYGAVDGTIYCPTHMKEAAPEQGFHPQQGYPPPSSAPAKNQSSEETQAKFRAFRTEGRKCRICAKTVYATEEVKAEERNEVFLYHKVCFRCQHEDEEGLQVCNRALDLRSYGSSSFRPLCEGHIYCNTHLKLHLQSKQQQWASGSSTPRAENEALRAENDSLRAEVVALRAQLERAKEAAATDIKVLRAQVALITPKLRAEVAELRRAARAAAAPQLPAVAWNDVERVRVAKGFDVLGKGASGVVYRAEWGGREVALKVMTGVSEEQLATFRAESATQAQLRHAHIVALLAMTVDEDEGRVGQLLELCKGGSLDHALAAGACGDGRWCVARLHEVALALAYLHEEALLAHRDVKPANVLLTSGAGEVGCAAKLSDFGASRLAEGMGMDAASLSVRGTLAYMAPELDERRAVGGGAAGTDTGAAAVSAVEVARQSPAIDQFAFAVMAVELLAGGTTQGAAYGASRARAALASEEEVLALVSSTGMDALDLADVCFACGSLDPAARPPFALVAAKLGGMLGAGDAAGGN
jgi:Protein kinase domain